MIHLALTLTFAAFVALLPSTPPAAGGGEPATPAAVLPASSYGCVQFAGLAACRSAAADMGLLRMIEGFARKTGHHPVDQAAQFIGQVDEKLGEIGLDRAVIREVLQGRMALGVGRPTFFGDTPMPSLCLAIDVEGRRSAAERVLATLQAFLMKVGPDMVRETETSAGVEMTVVHPREHNGAIATALVGRYALVASSPAYLRDCLRTIAGELPSLAENPVVRRSTAALDGGGLLTAYVNTGRLLGWVGGFLPYEADSITEALGVAGLDGVFLGIDAGTFGSREVFHLGLRNETDGLLQGLLGRPLTHRAARLCPDDSLIYLSASVDVPALFEFGEKLMAALPPEARLEIEREVRREVEREIGHAGVDADQMMQMLSSFGPEMTVAVPMPGVSSLMPTVMAFVDVRGQADVEAMLLGLLQKTGVPLKSASFRDRQIHYVSVEEEGFRLSPAFVVEDGTLALCSDLRALKAALARRDEGGGSLAAAPDFDEAVRRAKGASMMLDVRLADNMAKIWQVVEPRLEGLLDAYPAVPLTLDDLPTAEQMQQAFTDIVGTLTVDREGVTAKSDLPIGAGGLLAAVGSWADQLLAGEPGRDKKRKIY